MKKYETLVAILDHIRKESNSTPFSVHYLPDPSSEERVNQARARAFVHLYLKVSFGIMDFVSREVLITDGAFDGGVDAYHVDRENRVIHFIQSKYRVNEQNFISRFISLSELLVMDISRI
ncbi:MAG: AIPR protein, partial [Acidobacteriota bacterium]